MTGCEKTRSRFAIGTFISLLFILSGTATAVAQTPLIDELVGKAQSELSEDGFCARTGWPAGDDVAKFTVLLHYAVPKFWNVSTFSNGSCVLNRVDEVLKQDGGKCVRYTFYVCVKGGKCGVGKSLDCLDSSGKFVSRRGE